MCATLVNKLFSEMRAKTDPALLVAWYSYSFELVRK